MRKFKEFIKIIALILLCALAIGACYSILSPKEDPDDPIVDTTPGEDTSVVNKAIVVYIDGQGYQAMSGKDFAFHVENQDLELLCIKDGAVFSADGSKILMRNGKNVRPEDILFDGAQYTFGEILEGDGTEENPYLVDDLHAYVALVTDAKAGAIPTGAITYVELTDDIALPAAGDTYGGLTSDELAFATADYGTGENAAKIAWRIDGKGHTISNMTRPLFSGVGELSEGVEFRNLTLSGNVVSPARYCAMFVGYLAGDSAKVTLENCKTVGSVTSNKADKNMVIGGFVGLVSNGADVTLTNCTNDARIFDTKATTTLSLGGMIGSVNAYGEGGKEGRVSVEGCINNGVIEGTLVPGVAPSGLGGMVGTFVPSLVKPNYTLWLDVIDCVNNGAISTAEGDELSEIGGMLGLAQVEPQYAGVVGSGSSATVTINNCSTTVDGQDMYNVVEDYIVIYA